MAVDEGLGGGVSIDTVDFNSITAFNDYSMAIAKNPIYFISSESKTNEQSVLSEGAVLSKDIGVYINNDNIVKSVGNIIGSFSLLDSMWNNDVQNPTSLDPGTTPTQGDTSTPYPGVPGAQNILIVMSDQAENDTAIPGVSEKQLVTPIGIAIAQYLNALGYGTWAYQPNKNHNLSTQLAWNPTTIIFLHCDSPGHDRPQGVMGVMDSSNPIPKWSTDIVNYIGARMAWGVWGAPVTDVEISTNAPFWFFTQCAGLKIKTLVLELVNMNNSEQAFYLNSQPVIVGNMIGSAIHSYSG
jgi:hypothetical protein